MRAGAQGPPNGQQGPPTNGQQPPQNTNQGPPGGLSGIKPLVQVRPLLKINGAKEMAELAGGSIDLPGGFSLPIPSGLVVRVRRATCLLGASLMREPAAAPPERPGGARVGARYACLRRPRCVCLLLPALSGLVAREWARG